MTISCGGGARELFCHGILSGLELKLKRQFGVGTWFALEAELERPLRVQPVFTLWYGLSGSLALYPRECDGLAEDAE